MQEFITPLAAVSSGIGLVIAGVNIAKGSRKYAGKEETNNGFKRVDCEIKDVKRELAEKASRKDVEKLSTVFERQFDRMEMKIDGQTEEIKELVKGFAGMKAVMEQLRSI